MIEDVPAPTPGEQEVLVRVGSCRVAPWDALIREGLSKVSPQVPLTLGSDLSGVVPAFGKGVSGFAAGGTTYGVTSPGAEGSLDPEEPQLMTSDQEIYFGLRGISIVVPCPA